MGGACSVGKNEETSAEGAVLEAKKSFKTLSLRSFGKRKKGEISDQRVKSPVENDSGEVRLSFCGEFFPATPRKSADSKRSSFTAKTGISGLERAIEVLDALGSGVANFNSSGFISNFTVRGNKICILAFEVANTITKAASLMQSLSEKNVRYVKQTVFFTEGVQRLVSTDINVLLSITAADKREELDIFCREIVRFGDLCKDPQWHNLDRFFSKLNSENAAYGPPTEAADQKMQELTILAYHTAELYHELNALDRFEQDYRHKREEAESLNLPCKESLAMLQTELKHQKRLVSSLKRKSLWSKRMEEIVENLVDIVAFIHQQISEVFGNIDAQVGQEPFPERLGVSGLALHYANLTNQIDNIASRPAFLPANTRDSLYRGLPTSVKNALRSSLRTSDYREELSVPQIKAKLDSVLEWLVPMASSTSSMYRGFGWVGEWANTSSDFRKQAANSGNIIRLQTLYHADKQKIDSHILELVKLLHHLIYAAKQRDNELISSLAIRASDRKGLPARSAVRSSPSLGGGKPIRVELSQDERNLLERVSQIQSLPIVSKSQSFSSIRRRSFKMRASCRSTGSSPCRLLTRKEAEFHDDDDSDFEAFNHLDLAY